MLEVHRGEPSPSPFAEPAQVRPRVGNRGALRFLIDAGQTLANTLEYEKTLQAVADLAVPRVACFCVVDILGAGGNARRVAMAHVDLKRLAALDRVVAFAPEPSSDSPEARVVGSGEPMLFSPVTDDWIRETAADDEERWKLLRELELTSLIVVPLAARGNALGALVLGSIRTDRHYSRVDLGLARELGRIASVAIDNARLYRQAQDAIRSRDAVLRAVAHDLRAPISTVMMAASLLVDEAPEEIRTGPAGRALATIRSSAEHANRMIDGLLDVARIESGRLPMELTPVPAATLLRGAVAMHRHAADARGIELHARTSDNLPQVLADPDRVLRVFGNLLGNALKFTPKGGRIDVCAEDGNDEVHLWVADTGAGIAPDELPHVFDAFWQASRTDRSGLGLGLAIVRGLVEAHGGRVWAESALGEGTRIHFTLPRAARP